MIKSSDYIHKTDNVVQVTDLSNAKILCVYTCSILTYCKVSQRWKERHRIKVKPRIDHRSLLRIFRIQFRLGRIGEIADDRARLIQHKITLGEDRDLMAWIQPEKLGIELLTLVDVDDLDFTLDAEISDCEQRGAGRRRDGMMEQSFCHFLERTFTVEHFRLN